MLEAHIYRKEGYTQHEIAEKLGVTDRTVRNYLNSNPCQRKKREYSSKLDPYREFIEGIIKERPYYNCVLLFERLQKMGFEGKVSILREYVSSIRKKIISEAVIRYETEPGLQAQVDWAEFGLQTIGGKQQKLYAFVIELGYSRKPHVRFTTSMKQGTLHACHKLAFENFQGVPREILYDNMKTAFVCDSEGNFYPNKRLLAFANHYGYVPRRCLVRRPQTKGKVERFIHYLENNFWPRMEGKELTLDLLNEEVQKWIETISFNEIRELGETRQERFEREQPVLNALPVHDYDIRDMYELKVSRESLISFETNRYSVPPEYIGEMLTVKVDPLSCNAEIFRGSRSIRTIILQESGSRAKIIYPEDKIKIREIWEAQRKRHIQTISQNKMIIEAPDVDIRSPQIYEQIGEAIQ